MRLDITDEEAAILQEMLESDLKSVEIEAIRSDNIEYHRMLQHRTELIEGILRQIQSKSPSA